MADAKSEKARRIATARLLPGEKLVWWSPARGASGAGFVTLGFFLIWTLFALAWTGLAFLFMSFGDEPAEGVFRFFPFFGVPFVAVGVLGLINSVSNIGGLVYALTDRRVLLIQGKKMREFTAPHFRNMERDGGGQRGSIGFAHSAIEFGAKPTAWLRNIDDPERVEALIREHVLAGR